MNNVNETVFEMDAPVLLASDDVKEHITRSVQVDMIGGLLAEAVSEGRKVQIKMHGEEILVLLSPADDLGQAWTIDDRGGAAQIGVTQRA